MRLRVMALRWPRSLPQPNVLHFAFFLFGLTNNLTGVIFLSAAEILLPNQAGLILLFSILPGLLTKLSLGLWAHRVSYRVRVSVLDLTLALCCLLPARAGASVGLTLGAVATAAVAGATGEGSFLALAARWPGCVGAWSSGTGAAGLVGASVFVAMRALGCNVADVLRVASAAPVVSLGVYWVVVETGRGERAGWVEMGDLEKEEEENGDRADGDMVGVLGRAEWNREDEKSGDGVQRLLGDTKREILGGMLMRFILPLVSVYFSEYSVNQGVLPTLDSDRKSVV